MSQHETSSPQDAARWKAVLARDPGADGAFVFAVATTGIYCRPSCPARRPRPEHAAFYDTPDAAEAAGFRACKRCRPNAAGVADRQVAAIRKACALIDSGDDMPRTSALARAVGFSPSHFHRQFTQLVGVTPKEYAAGRRVKRLQDRLTAGGRVTDAIYDAGFQSGSRAYATTRSTLGMTPSQYRAGGANVAVRYACAKSALGWVLAAATPEGVCAIEFGDSRRTLERRVRARFPAATSVGRDAALEAWLSHIVAYVATPGVGLELPLDVQGTAFQRRVWRELQAIPRGQTSSYSQIARAIGRPDAARAVAQACASNTLAVAIPCHRVVRADGALGGYKWGVARKQALVDREAGAASPREARK